MADGMSIINTRTSAVTAAMSACKCANSFRLCICSVTLDIQSCTLPVEDELESHFGSQFLNQTPNSEMDFIFDGNVKQSFSLYCTSFYSLFELTQLSVRCHI